MNRANRFMTLLLPLAGLLAIAAGCGGNPRSVDGRKPADFVADLSSSDQKQREAARKALVLMGPNSVEALTDYFSKADSAGKVDVADLLTRIKEDAKKAAPVLLDALSHKDESVRNAARSALSNMGPAPVEGLAKLAAGSDRDLALLALDTLSSIGAKAKASIGAVSGLVSAQDPLIRSAAVKTIGRVGQSDRKAVDALVKASSDPDPEVRRNAAFALGQVRTSAKAAVEALLAATRDQDRDVRMIAAESLGRFGKDAAAARGRIVEMASDPDGAVRGQAIVSSVTLEMPLERAIPLFVDSMTSCPEAQRKNLAEKVAVFAVSGSVKKLDKVLVDVMKWMGALYLGDSSRAATARLIVENLGAKTVPHLSAMITAKDPMIKGAAASVLAEIGEGAKDAIDDLTALLDDPEVPGREQAATTLGRIGPTARPAIAKLIERAADTDMSVRSAAISALALLGPKPEQALPVLVGALSDPQSEVADRAAMAIAALGSDAASTADALKSALFKQDGIRWPALVALGEIGALESDAIPALAAGLKKPERPARRDAAKALGVLGEKAAPAAAALAAALSDDDAQTREIACFALGRMPSAAASHVAAIEPLIDDSDPSVRLRAVEALLALNAAPPQSVQSVLGVLELAVRDIQDPRNVNVLTWASELISRLGGKSDDVVGLLAGAIKAGRFKRAPGVVLKVLDTMRILGPSEKSAIPALVWLIENDEDEEVFVKSAAYVSSFGADGKVAVDGLVEYGIKARNFPKLQIAAANALGEIGKAAAFAIPEIEKARGVARNEEAKRALETAVIRIRAGG